MYWRHCVEWVARDRISEPNHLCDHGHRVNIFEPRIFSFTKFKNNFFSPKMLHHRKQRFYLSMVPFENAGEGLGQQGICLCDSTGRKERRWIFSKVLKKRCNRRKTSPHSSSCNIIYSYVNWLTSWKEDFLLLDWCLDWTQSKLEKFLKNSTTRVHQQSGPASFIPS